MSRVIAIAISLIAALILGGIFAPQFVDLAGRPPVPVASTGLPDTAEVVARVNGSVVSVRADLLVEEQVVDEDPPPQIDELLVPQDEDAPADPFRGQEEDHSGDTAGEPAEPVPGDVRDTPGDEEPDRPEPRSGTRTRIAKETRGGTGLVVDGQGHIVTNYHVIEGAHRVRVELPGHGMVDAERVGVDPHTDLALLRVEAPVDLVPARLGDSDRLRVGEWVLAIGDPLNYQRTVTVGVVSGKGRRLSNELVTDFIQTDAAINVGSSGGPLLNLQGEVIGLNTAISRMRQSAFFQTIVEGVGFAVPSNTVREVWEQLRDEGRVARGYLGVSIEEVTPEAAESLGLDRPRGTMVMGVREGLPADRAGLMRGDVILEVEDEEVASPDDLIRKVTRHPPGGEVRLLLLREDGSREAVAAELVDREEESVRVSLEMLFRPNPAGLSRPSRLGFLVDDADRMAALSAGPIVTEVDPLSRAWDEGMREGTRLLEIANRPMVYASDVARALQGVEPGTVVRITASNGEWGPGPRLIFLRAD